MTLNIRKPYDPREAVRFAVSGKSMTQQSFKDQCDINNIMKRFEATGLADHVKQHGGTYDDYTGLPLDYHAAMNSVVEAQQMFETLPAKVRKRFGNDPGDFLNFVDTADDAAMREIGLLPPEVVVSDPPPADPAPPQAAPASPQGEPPDQGT